MPIPVKFLIVLLLWPASGAVSAAQANPSFPPRAAPHISGTLIGTDGVRKIILEYRVGSRRGTFVGNVQSACAIPAKTDSSPSTPLALSAIPMRSKLTLFYVRHTIHTKKGQRTESIVMAIRFDQANQTLGIGKDQIIPCYQSAQRAAPK